MAALAVNVSHDFENEATLTEHIAKKRKVSVGLQPFLVDENDALGTVRNVSVRFMYILKYINELRSVSLFIS